MDMMLCWTLRMYEDIKRNISITAVLRKYGYPAFDKQHYRIPCPIHHGRDANFSVSESDGLWNCFSVCGRGGSVIDLVAAFEKIDIKEAAEKLTTTFNVTPAQASVATARAIKAQVDQWKKLSSDGDVDEPVTTPLEEGYRGFNAKTISHWGIARVDNGVLIPLRNAKGKLCSYSVRRNDGKPKYDNAAGSVDCPLMGLYENKDEIIKQGFSYVTEGQFDCIHMWQNGFKNVVALRGSSLTEPQAMMLLALTSRLVLVLDGDAPGRFASLKIKERWNKVFDIKIVNLPDNKDPDDLNYKELIDTLHE